MSPPETVTFPLAQLRDELRRGDDETLQRARTHCTANSTQEVGPLRTRVDRLETTVNGEVGNDQRPGLVLKVRDLEHTVKTMQTTIPAALENLAEEVRGLTSNGRTPRGGTRIEIGERSDSEPPSKKRPLIDRDTLKLLLIVLAAGGVPSAAAVVNTMRDDSTQAVEEKLTELERRERELAAREAWASKRSQRGAPAPAGTGGSP